MPVVNGKQAEIALRGAVGILILLIVAITVIVVQGKPIPEIFTTTATLLLGFLVGTRVLTNGAKAQADKQEAEKAVPNGTN